MRTSSTEAWKKDRIQHRRRMSAMPAVMVPGDLTPHYAPRVSMMRASMQNTIVGAGGRPKQLRRTFSDPLGAPGTAKTALHAEKALGSFNTARKSLETLRLSSIADGDEDEDEGEDEDIDALVEEDATLEEKNKDDNDKGSKEAIPGMSIPEVGFPSLDFASMDVGGSIMSLSEMPHQVPGFSGMEAGMEASMSSLGSLGGVVSSSFTSFSRGPSVESGENEKKAPPMGTSL